MAQYCRRREPEYPGRGRGARGKDFPCILLTLMSSIRRRMGIGFLVFGAGMATLARTEASIPDGAATEEKDATEAARVGKKQADGERGSAINDVDDGRSVHGRLWGSWKGDYAGQRAVIGRQVSLADETGAFVLAKVRVPYDIAITDPNGTRVSAYLGVKRRDPSLVQMEASVSTPASPDMLLRSPPQVHQPESGARISQDSPIAWDAEGDGVFMLDLRPANPTLFSPRIQILTAKTKIQWRELVAAGVVFPAGAEYTLTVSRVLPAASMDEMTSAAWRGWHEGGMTFVVSQRIVFRFSALTATRNAAKPRSKVPMYWFGLPEGLPPCRAIAASRQGPTPIDANQLGTKVTLLGRLSHSRWACTLKGCIDTPSCCNTCSAHWQISGIAGAVDNVALEAGLGAKECQLPAQVEIPVRATGILTVSNYSSLDDGGLVLVQANLCVIQNAK